MIALVDVEVAAWGVVRIHVKMPVHKVVVLNVEDRVGLIVVSAAELLAIEQHFNYGID